MAIPAENGWDCRGPRSRPCARVLRPATVQAFFEAPRPPRNAIPARGPVDDTHRSEHVSGERGAIAADGHLGTGAFPLTWSTGTGGSDRGWYRPARDLWHYWPASGWFNLRPYDSKS